MRFWDWGLGLGSGVFKPFLSTSSKPKVETGLSICCTVEAKVERLCTVPKSQRHEHRNPSNVNIQILMLAFSEPISALHFFSEALVFTQFHTQRSLNPGGRRGCHKPRNRGAQASHTLKPTPETPKAPKPPLVTPIPETGKPEKDPRRSKQQ